MKRSLSILAGLLLAMPVLAQQGISKTEILLGAIPDLSGPIASVGVNTRDGMMMRIDEANAAGGIHGRKIRMLVEDSGYDPKRAVLAAQKLATGEKVFAVVGLVGTANNVAAMPILFENNVISFMPMSGGRVMFDPPERLKIALIQPNPDLIEAGIRYLVKKKNHTKVCVLYQDDEFGQEHLRGTEAALKALGMPLTERTSYKRGATDFSTQIARLKGAGCSLVGLGTVVRETIGVMTEAQKSDFKADFVGGEAVYSTTTHQMGGKATEGLYAMHGMNNVYADDPSKVVRDWVAAYKAKFNMDPTITSVYAYSFMDIFVAAATKVGPNLTTDTLIDTMETNLFPSKLGGPDFKLTKTMRLGASQLSVAQIQNGRWVQLGDAVSVQR
jgi:branched-chain amino acid transport system substrate-binding protein